MLASWLPTTQQADIPTLLIKGFAVPTLIAELLVIAVAMREPAARRIGITVSPLQKTAIISFLLIAFATAIFSAPEPVESLIRTTILLVHLLFGFSIYRLAKAELLKPALLCSALISGFMVCFAALLLFAWQVRAFDFNWMHDTPDYVNIRNLGYYTAAVAALMFARLAVAEERAALAWNFACATIAVGLIFWSGARGAIVALIATYLAAALFCPALRRVSAWGYALLACGTGYLLPDAIGAPRLPGMGVERMVQTEAFPLAARNYG